MPGDFALINRFLLEAPLDEWLAVLPDGTEVVVPGDAYAPDVIGMRKARDVLEARVSLESQARQLLAALAPQTTSWRLLSLDFGTAARRHQCDFLMCFVPDDAIRGPYVEVGVMLHDGQREARRQLTICSTWSGAVDLLRPGAQGLGHQT